MARAPQTPRKEHGTPLGLLSFLSIEKLLLKHNHATPRRVGHIEFRARAAVPIVVFTDKQLGVSVDISVQGRGGVDGEATTRVRVHPTHSSRSA